MPFAFDMPCMAWGPTSEDNVNSSVYGKMEVSLPIAEKPAPLETPQKCTHRKQTQKQLRSHHRQREDGECTYHSDASPTAMQDWTQEEEGDNGIESTEKATTMMITNIPCRYGEDALVQAIASVGFAGKYDFVYVPKRNASQDGNIGYAFVNFKDFEDAEAFAFAFHNYRFEGSKSLKACEVKRAHHQGFNPHDHCLGGNDRPSNPRRSRRQRCHG